MMAGIGDSTRAIGTTVSRRREFQPAISPRATPSGSDTPKPIRSSESEENMPRIIRSRMV